MIAVDDYRTICDTLFQDWSDAMKSLKDWREGKGWSTQRLAQELGLDDKSGAGTVWRWETGRSRPDADIVAKIAEVTGGAVTAHDMHLTRLSHLRTKESEGAAA